MFGRNTNILFATIIFGLALVLSSAVAFAQFPTKYKEKKQLNLTKYDRRLMHFGFSLGMNYSDIAVKTAANIQSLDSVYIVESKGGVGFNLGIVSDLRMGEHFNLRFIPGISFVGRGMQYTFIEQDTVPIVYDKTVNSVYLEVPLYFKFRSRRINNWRVYIIGGGKFLFDMATKEEVKSDEIILKMKREDYTWDLGVGVDFYLEYFKLSTEVKMAFGLNNLLVEDQTAFTNSIQSLKSKTFLFSIYFE
ncbi:MAG: PorT family protein [Flavobacteriales bacterium]|nr:PorT family protein [Flavobacteriales bacterium]